MFRLRCIILRHILFWLLFVTTIKLTSIFYFDLQQQQDIDSGSASFPFVGGIPKPDSNRKSINRTRPMPPVAINRSAIRFHRQYVHRKNRQQHMLNRNLFSSTATRYILLVQVHTRVVYLKKFIEMLRDVQTIESTLLIFSHDFIDPDINALVTNITFVPVRRQRERITPADSSHRSILGDSDLLPIFTTALS